MMIPGLFVWVMHHLVFRFTVQISAIAPPSAGDAPDARETSVILAWLLLVVCCCRVQGSDQLGEKRDPWERLPSRRGTNHTLTPLPGGSSIPQAPPRSPSSLQLRFVPASCFATNHPIPVCLLLDFHSDSLRQPQLQSTRQRCISPIV